MIVILLTVATLGVAGYYLYRASRGFRSMYTVRQQRPDSIGDVADRTGSVDVAGTAVPVADSDTVTAPFTGIDCLGYTYRTEERIDSNTPADAPRSEDGTYVVLDEGTQCVPFIVEDSTGSVRVEPDGATLEFETQTHQHFPWRELPDPIEAYINSTRDIEMQRVVLESVPILNYVATWFMTNDRRFIEGRLDIDEPVYVRGQVTQTAGWDQSADSTIGSETTEPNASDFVIYNTPKQATARRFTKQAGRDLVIGLAGVGTGLAVTYGYFI